MPMCFFLAVYGKYYCLFHTSPDMYNGIIFISIKCVFYGFFFIKPHLYCTYVMHISESFHYLYQSSFFCACHKLEPSFPKQSQIVIKIIMVYTITHLINSIFQYWNVVSSHENIQWEVDVV
jgi:hypothetical protein